VLIALAVVAVLLVALALGLPVLDRVLADLAERKAADYLTGPFGSPATIRVLGTPFLTQVLRGRYRDVEVVGGPRIGDINGATLVAHLTNVYLPLRDLLGRRTTELPCERVEGRLLVPYSEVARVAKIPGLALAFEGERLMASASLPVPVPGISQLARIQGEAVLSPAAGGPVWLQLRGISVAGITLPSLALSQLLPTLNVPIHLPAMPFGLRLDELRPTANGLVVDGSAEAVVFRRMPVADLPSH
jgi:hypothetical protein